MQVEYSYDGTGDRTIIYQWKAEMDKVYNPFGFCGEYFDEETGLIYLRNRYYNPNTGRFITEDPAKDGLNWYVYCENNPVMFVDPNGESVSLLVTIVGGAIIGALVAGVSNIVSQSIENKGFNDIRWGEVGINALGGAASGALGGSGLNRALIITGNALISAGTYAGTQKVNNKEIKKSDLLISAGIGAALGMKGGSSKEVIKELTEIETTYYISRWLGLQSGMEINKQAFKEVASKAWLTSIWYGFQDEIISGIGSRILDIGSKGDDVRNLQAILGVEQDGIYGPQTKNALKELQEKMGITADGVYGNETRTALKSLFN